MEITTPLSEPDGSLISIIFRLRNNTLRHHPVSTLIKIMCLLRAQNFTAAFGTTQVISQPAHHLIPYGSPYNKNSPHPDGGDGKDS